MGFYLHLLIKKKITKIFPKSIVLLCLFIQFLNLEAAFVLILLRNWLFYWRKSYLMKNLNLSKKTLIIFFSSTEIYYKMKYLYVENHMSFLII